MLFSPPSIFIFYILKPSVEHFSLLLKDPDQPENPKVSRVAIIGAPNAGKSTLTNQLLGKKVIYTFNYLFLSAKNVE